MSKALVDIEQISVEECWDRLRQQDSSQLVDVRSQAEWAFVGVPDLSSIGKEPIFLEWLSLLSGKPHPDFVAKLSQNIGGEKTTPLYFLCRSGTRSLAAAMAMTQAGFENCFNVLCGFEGELDESHHRGQKNGWKSKNLLWRQN